MLQVFGYCEKSSYPVSLWWIWRCASYFTVDFFIIIIIIAFFLGERRGTRTPKHFVNITGESKTFKMLEERVSLNIFFRKKGLLLLLYLCRRTVTVAYVSPYLTSLCQIQWFISESYITS
jgi:hypothetical protein